MTTAAQAAWWPRYREPGDLTAIEAVPLSERNLPTSTWALVDRAARLWPERTAITVLPSTADWNAPLMLTYANLRAEVVRIAGALARVGVSSGDAVGVLSPNTASVVCATLAAQAVGVVAPVNPGLDENRIRALLLATRARVLIVAGPELDPKIWQVATRLASDASVATLLVLRPDDATGPAPELPPVAGATLVYLNQLAAVEPGDHLAAYAPHAEDAAAYFHTGGTTGAPKMAVHTHANQVTMAWSLAAHPSTDTDGPVFAALPLFHVNALLVTCLAPLMAGRPVVWAPPLGYRDPTLLPVLWKLIEHYQISGMSAVPTVYAALCEVPVDADITSLRTPVVGAAPLPEAVRRGFAARTGVELLEGYGMTEATCASAVVLPGCSHPGSVGQRLPYQHIKAVALDPDTGGWSDLPAGNSGLLVISGPTVFAGYLQDGVPTRDGVVRDGWLDTGDLGAVDADGHIYLSGRAKDLIIRGGHNIDPAAIEEALLCHPAVTAAAAVGQPDKHAGEVPIAYVVLQPNADGTDPSTEDLRAWAAARVPEAAAAPKDILVIDHIPLTAVGKVFKPALRTDAARRCIAADLAALGSRAHLAEPDGTTSVRLTAPAEEADHLRDLLSQYAIDWHLAIAAGTT